jgi:hypothetical protein
MNMFGQGRSLPSSQWIATGYALAMTRVEGRESTCKLLTIVIARKEQSERRGNPLHAIDAFGQGHPLPGS